MAAVPAVPELGTAFKVRDSEVAVGVKLITPKLHEAFLATVAEAQAPAPTAKSAAFAPLKDTGVAARMTEAPEALMVAVPVQEAATPIAPEQVTPVTETVATP